jgi:hypothetical protein
MHMPGMLQKHPFAGCYILLLHRPQTNRGLCGSSCGFRILASYVQRSLLSRLEVPVVVVCIAVLAVVCLLFCSSASVTGAMPG